MDVHCLSMQHNQEQVNGIEACGIFLIIDDAFVMLGLYQTSLLACVEYALKTMHSETVQLIIYCFCANAELERAY
jgi:hypothetical protein